jgi:hypothetical protein
VIGDTVASGNYTATAAAGGITQTAGTGLNVSGSASFTADNASIILDNSNNRLNDAVSVNGTNLDDVTLYNPQYDLELGSFTLLGDLSIQAKQITQSGAINVPGTATFNATDGSIDLTNNSNDFVGEVTLLVNTSAAYDVAVTDKNAIILAGGQLGTGNLTVVAGAGGEVGGITQTNAFVQAPGAGTASFTGGNGDIVLNNVSNEFTGPVALSTSGTSNTTILDATALQLAAGTFGGNLSATARALKMHRRTLQRKLAKRPVRE